MTEDKPGEAHSQPGPWLQNVGGMQEAENDGILTLEEIKAHLRVDHDADDDC